MTVHEKVHKDAEGPHVDHVIVFLSLVASPEAVACATCSLFWASMLVSLSLEVFESRNQKWSMRLIFGSYLGI